MFFPMRREATFVVVNQKRIRMSLILTMSNLVDMYNNMDNFNMSPSVYVNTQDEQNLTMPWVPAFGGSIVGSKGGSEPRLA